MESANESPCNLIAMEVHETISTILPSTKLEREVEEIVGLIKVWGHDITSKLLIGVVVWNVPDHHSGPRFFFGKIHEDFFQRLHLGHPLFLLYLLWLFIRVQWFLFTTFHMLEGQPNWWHPCHLFTSHVDQPNWNRLHHWLHLNDANHLLHKKKGLRHKGTLSDVLVRSRDARAAEFMDFIPRLWTVTLLYIVNNISAISLSSIIPFRCQDFTPERRKNSLGLRQALELGQAILERHGFATRKNHVLLSFCYLLYILNYCILIYFNMVLLGQPVSSFPATNWWLGGLPLQNFLDHQTMVEMRSKDAFVQDRTSTKHAMQLWSSDVSNGHV